MRRRLAHLLAAAAMVTSSLGVAGTGVVLTASPASAAPKVITCRKASLSTTDDLTSGPALFTGTVSRCHPFRKGSISLLLFAGPDGGGTITWAGHGGVSGLTIEGIVGQLSNCGGNYEADLTFTVTSGTPGTKSASFVGSTGRVSIFCLVDFGPPAVAVNLGPITF